MFRPITSDQASNRLSCANLRLVPISIHRYLVHPLHRSYPFTRNVFFTIGGRRFGVPIEDLARKASDETSGMCISGVQVSGMILYASKPKSSAKKTFREGCRMSQFWAICSMSCCRIVVFPESRLVMASGGTTNSHTAA